MFKLFFYYWWIPLIYLGLGLILIGGCFLPIWNRAMDKFDKIRISEKGYRRLMKFSITSGIILLAISWYIIVMRNIYGMHPFIFATFMLQPIGQTLVIFGFFMYGRSLRFGTLGAYFLVILYSCLGMIVIHDIFWCARRTDWYTHSWEAGEDLILYVTLTGAPYDYLIFGESMMLQLILLVGAAFALLYVLERRLKKNPDDFLITDKTASQQKKSKMKIFFIPLLIFYLSLFGFAISVDIIDDIRYYGELQYTLALHFYLPFFTCIALLGMSLFKRDQSYNKSFKITGITFLGLMTINALVSFIAALQLINLLQKPVMINLYKTLISFFNLEWSYLSVSLIFGIESIILTILFLYMDRSYYNQKRHHK